MSALSSRTILLVVAVLMVGILPADVWAQGNAMNPYGNSGYADYREFAVPSYSNNPALPGQTINSREPIVTRPRANSYNQYVDEDDDGGFESNQARRGSSAGVPYNQAYQQLNRQYNRVYKANDSKQNQEFVERLKKRDEAFAMALKEKDPVKRAKLIRDLDNDSLSNPKTAAKPKSNGTSKAPEPNSARANSLKAPAPPGSSSANSTTTRRTTSAPPPVDGVGPRRSTSSNGTTSTAPRGTGASTGTSRPAPDPSTIAVPSPR